MRVPCRHFPAHSTRRALHFIFECMCLVLRSASRSGRFTFLDPDACAFRSLSNSGVVPAPWSCHVRSFGFHFMSASRRRRAGPAGAGLRACTARLTAISVQGGSDHLQPSEPRLHPLRARAARALASRRSGSSALAWVSHPQRNECVARSRAARDSRHQLRRSLTRGLRRGPCALCGPCGRPPPWPKAWRGRVREWAGDRVGVCGRACKGYRRACNGRM